MCLSTVSLPPDYSCSRSPRWPVIDLRKSDVLGCRRLAATRSAPCVRAVENKREWYVAAIARYIPIQSASAGSIALKKERYRKSAAPAQADKQHAAMTGGRPQGGADDGAVLDGCQLIA